MKAKAKPNGPDIFAAYKKQWLDSARAAAYRLLQSRESVTAEDVTAACPLPRYIHRNLIGSVFQTPEFQMVGIAVARNKAARGHLVRKWALKNPPLPKKWVSSSETVDTR